MRFDLDYLAVPTPSQDARRRTQLPAIAAMVSRPTYWLLKTDILVSGTAIQLPSLLSAKSSRSVPSLDSPRSCSATSLTLASPMIRPDNIPSGESPQRPACTVLRGVAWVAERERWRYINSRSLSYARSGGEEVWDGRNEKCQWGRVAMHIVLSVCTVLEEKVSVACV